MRKLAAAGLLMLSLGSCRVEQPGLRFPIERTPQRVARGRDLAEVVHCMYCHSETDWKTGQPLPGTAGAGVQSFPDDGFQWVVAPNITSDPETGAGRWSDEQLANAIRNGIGHDGRRLIAFMPYPALRQLPDEDLASIIVYVRSLPPVRRRLKPIVVPKEFEALRLQLPPLRSVPPPDLSTPVKRGEWLAALADCKGCHSSVDRKFEPIRGMEFGGGLWGTGRYGSLTASNLTRDPTGIAYYDETVFLRTIRTGRVNGVRPLSGFMPWSYFRNLTDDDLRAIFAYLRSLPPVNHHATNAEPIAMCRKCGTAHGGGALNH